MTRALAVLAFLAAILGVAVGGHLYLAQRLVLDLALPDPLETALLALVAAMAATLFLQPLGERLLERRWARLLAWPASLWMGLAFWLLLLVAVSDVALWLWAAPARAAAGPTVPVPGASRLRAACVLGLAVVTGGIALRGALRPPALRRLSVPLARWPRALAGFRIVQISDIHIGPILDARFARALVERVNALEPDLIAVTGDLVDGSVRRLREEVAPLAGLRARHGVFFVTGNHDYFSGADAWVARVRELGMRTLRNERVRVERDGAAFLLAGVEDHHAYMVPGGLVEDLPAALDGRDPDLALVLLAHDPGTFRKASAAGVDLQLSGHTHGGQIWPFVYLVRLAVPWVAGLYERRGAKLYVSRGTGFWGPPMRLFAPAEITELALHPAP